MSYMDLGFTVLLVRKWFLHRWFWGVKSAPSYRGTLRKRLGASTGFPLGGDDWDPQDRRFRNRLWWNKKLRIWVPLHSVSSVSFGRVPKDMHPQIDLRPFLCRMITQAMPPKQASIYIYMVDFPAVKGGRASHKNVSGPV